MTKEITACRVCGNKELVGYYGLCAEHQKATIVFWERLRSNLQAKK